MLLSLLAAALAAPAISPGDYDGAYDLRCDSAALSLNLALGISGPAGAAGWSGATTLPLPCAVPARYVVAYARGVEADCRAGGVPRQLCRDYALGVYQAILPFTRAGEVLVPDAADLWVEPVGFFDLHTAHLTYTWADGGVSWGDLLLDNTAGPNAGHIAGFGLVVNGGSVPGAACLMPIAASVDGTINPQTFEVNAVYSFTGQQLCAGVASGGWAWTIDLGLSGTATVSGGRM
jgi:hypothetical protein